jgi:hypothetical protein
VALEPSQEYRRRAEARRAAVAELDRRDLTTSRLRLLAFAALIASAVFAWRGTIHVGWIAVPIAGFAYLVKRHERVFRARDVAERAVAFYERGLARIEDRWAGGGETGERFRDDGHLYANDLDLFGPASLFELLSVARTQSGEETLARWLMAPASRDEILLRQDAVRELMPRLDLRETLALAGAGVRAAVHTRELIAWAERPSELGARWTRWAAAALTALAVAALALVLINGQWLPLVLVVIVQGLFRSRQRTQLETVLHSTSGLVRELSVLRDALTRLEREQFSSAKLVALHDAIDAPHAPASRVIRRLERLVEAHDWEHNIVFTPIAAVLLWNTHIGWAIENWRRRHGARIRVWLQAVGEIEALSSLAIYGCEHPDDPFPLVGGDPPTAGAQARITGEGLGHPLLPATRMVRNHVRLGPERSLLVVSGSNMSGKSTLLRTLGVNVVMALAGGPVRAAALALTPLEIGATLRIQDSLTDGRSRFYAEITRVRAIVDLARRGPTLFLLDELFHGTNSHDRFAGATGVLRSLLDAGAIGLVTTHDLALTGIAAELAPRAANVHFEDELRDGQMYFDYTMKEGPVTRSNALALMRAVGLQVSEAPDD